MFLPSVSFLLCLSATWSWNHNQTSFSACTFTTWLLQHSTYWSTLAPLQRVLNVAVRTVLICDSYSLLITLAFQSLSASSTNSAYWLRKQWFVMHPGILLSQKSALGLHTDTTNVYSQWLRGLVTKTELLLSNNWLIDSYVGCDLVVIEDMNVDSTVKPGDLLSVLDYGTNRTIGLP